MAGLYAQRIGQLYKYLQDEESCIQAAETFRSLVDQVAPVLDNGELAIVLRGDLGAILRFTAGKKNPDFLAEAEALDNLLSPVSLVAGASNHLKLRLLSAYRAVLEQSALAKSSGLLRSAA